MEFINKIFENAGSSIWMALILILFFLKFELKNENLKEKFVVCYFLIYIIKLLNIVSFLNLIVMFIIISFIFLEFLYLDNFSKKLMKHTRYYVYDYFFKLIFQYHFFFFFIAVAMVTRKSLVFFEHYNIYIIKLKSVIIFFSFYIMVYTVKKIFNDKFKVNSFETIYKKMDHIMSFEKFKKTENIKMLSEILIEKEDKTYFIRKDNYNWLNFRFIEYRYKRFKYGLSKMYNLKIVGNFFCVIKIFFKFSKKIITIFYKLIFNFKKIITKKISINQIFIGHSTIEMQLIRTLALEDGYYLVFRRKIYELLYSTIFFKSLKEFYGYYQYKNYYNFKYYLIYIYMSIAPIQINGKNYSNIYELYNKKDKNSTFTKEQVYIWSLGLSHRKIDYSLLDSCPSIFSKKKVEKIISQLYNK